MPYSKRMRRSTVCLSNITLAPPRKAEAPLLAAQYWRARRHHGCSSGISDHVSRPNKRFELNSHSPAIQHIRNSSWTVEPHLSQLSHWQWARQQPRRQRALKRLAESKLPFFTDIQKVPRISKSTTLELTCHWSSQPKVAREQRPQNVHLRLTDLRLRTTGSLRFGLIARQT